MFSKIDGYMFFNAHDLTDVRYKSGRCASCKEIELQVVKELPGHSLYVLNRDGLDSRMKESDNGQHLNPAVIDGTMRVVQFGWENWRQMKNKFIEAYSKPVSHSGFTDDEESDDYSSQTLGRTPPSPPEDPDSMAAHALRSKLVRIQTDLRRQLNDNNRRHLGEKGDLGVSEAMVRWGDEHPILRVRAKGDKIRKIKAAIARLEAEEDLGADISSTMEQGLDEIMDRHNEWADYASGGHHSPPKPKRGFVEIDTQYRRAHGLPVVKFS